MSRVCDLTGKKAMTGNNVSFSNKKEQEKVQRELVHQEVLHP